MKVFKKIEYSNKHILSINSLPKIKKSSYININYSYISMKTKNISLLEQKTTLKGFCTKNKYQILEDYLAKRNKECEKNLSSFC